MSSFGRLDARLAERARITVFQHPELPANLLDRRLTPAESLAR